MVNNREIKTTHALLEMYANFVEYLNIQKSIIYINPVTLLDTSKRYWKDVDRLHSFHNISLIDCYKIAGYLTYWISKLKPISILDVNAYSPKYNELLININEYFGFYIAIGRIVDHYKQHNRYPNFNKLDKKFVESFIYNAKYRITTGDTLTMIYCLIGN